MIAVDLRPLLPALIVALAGLAALLVQAFTPKGKSVPAAPVALVGLLAALVATALIGSSRALGPAIRRSMSTTSRFSSRR